MRSFQVWKVVRPAMARTFFLWYDSIFPSDLVVSLQNSLPNVRMGRTNALYMMYFVPIFILFPQSVFRRQPNILLACTIRCAASRVSPPSRAHRNLSDGRLLESFMQFIIFCWLQSSLSIT